MKTKFILSGLLILVFSGFLMSCTTNVNTGNQTIAVDTDGDGNTDSNVEVDGNGTPTSGMFKGFYRYKTNGRENEDGTLTITNQLSSSVLVFEGELKPEAFIGTVKGTSSMKVVLSNTEKFETLIAISLKTYSDNYEKYKTIEAAMEKTPQSQALAYYSNIQSYTVSVSPKNLLGAGTWVFNNNTDYWVDVQCVDNSGTSYAVIAPGSLQVKVPVVLNQSYSAKFVYKKELRLNGKVIAVSDVSYQAQNEDFMLEEGDTVKTTDLSANANDLTNKVNPAICFINNTDKGIRVYNGDTLLSNYGSQNTDYVLNSGKTAMFTGLTASSTLAQLKIRSSAWTGAQSFSGNSQTLALGKVYVVTVSGNTKTDATIDLTWTVEEKDGAEYYTSGSSL